MHNLCDFSPGSFLFLHQNPMVQIHLLVVIARIPANVESTACKQNLCCSSSRRYFQTIDGILFFNTGKSTSPQCTATIECAKPYHYCSWVIAASFFYINPHFCAYRGFIKYTHTQITMPFNHLQTFRYFQYRMNFSVPVQHQICRVKRNANPVPACFAFRYVSLLFIMYAASVCIAT